jgi:hypothetical protein
MTGGTGRRAAAPTHLDESKSVAARLVHVTEHAQNEEQLRHEAENILEAACANLGYVWTPFQLERTLRRGRGKSSLFADVTHGAVVIEYEPPKLAF